MDGSLHSLVENKVVCPHCWNRFYGDEAKFISRHAELFGDPVLGEFENIRFGPREITKDRDGHALDPKGWKMTERACPRCHLQIPQDLLGARAVFVSIVGPPRSGKTYFITSMVHCLKRELAQYFGFSLSDADTHDIKAFAAHERALFYPDNPEQLTLLRKTEERGDLYNTVKLDGVKDVVLPKPFIFALRPTETNLDLPKYGKALRRDLVFYDNAGESFEFLKERDSRERVTQHLGEADAVFFALDPLQDPNARQKLAGVSSDPQLTRAPRTFRQDAFLNEVINRIRRHRDTTGATSMPVLAICVQKFDVWKSLLPYANTTTDSFPGSEGSSLDEGIIDHTSIEVDRTRGIGRLDIDEINRISLLVRAFVQDLYPEFVALAESFFSVVRYFPVSALGVSPEYQGGEAATSDVLKVKPSAIRPFRIAHPVLWLLARMKLIHHVHTPASSKNYAVASVRQHTGTRFWVTLPSSGQSLVLDREYLGTWVIDPYSGERVTIPALQEPQNSREAPAAVTGLRPEHVKTAPLIPKIEDVSLQLPPTPAKKRGWFRK